jgi:glycosyltransferase involved in cell wall biosynthesis
MPERPRVLQVGPDPDLGGGMAAALRGLLASPLAERFQLEVVSTYRGRQPLRRLALFFVALIRIAVWSLSGRGRIVHIHVTVRGSSYRKSICVLLAKALRRRVVLQVHSGAREVAEFRGRLSRPALLLIRTAFDAADVVLAVSAASAEALRDAYGLEAVEVIPNPAPSVTPFERETDPDRPPLVAYLGGFANPIKGGAVLIDAIVVALNAAPGLRFALAGPGDPPAAAAALFAAEPGVTWEGWLGAGEKEQLLRRAEIFVIPSLSEGLPMALLEAISYRLAVVATAVGGIPEVVESGREALLVDPGDAGQLAAALSRLAGDADLRRALAAAAGRRVESLDPAVVAAELEVVYDTLLSSV